MRMDAEASAILNDSPQLSPQQLQPELNLALCCRGDVDLTCSAGDWRGCRQRPGNPRRICRCPEHARRARRTRRGKHTYSRHPEVRTVQNIEEFSAELQFDCFREICSLEKGRIELAQA